MVQEYLCVVENASFALKISIWRSIDYY